MSDENLAREKIPEIIDKVIRDAIRGLEKDLPKADCYSDRVEIRKKIRELKKEHNV